MSGDYTGFMASRVDRRRSRMIELCDGETVTTVIFREVIPSIEDELVDAILAYRRAKAAAKDPPLPDAPKD